MDPEEFRRRGHQIVDWIADYRKSIESRPVQAPLEPGAVRASLPSTPPELPEPFDDVMRDLDQCIAPGLTHWQHPRFFGYFPSNGDLSSVLGDYISTGLGVLGLSWQSSPALTELEETTVDWMRQLLGLSPAWSGVIQDTASTSTLIALLCARERASNFSLAASGMQRIERPLTVYASEQSHSSVEKAALLAGFGRAHVRKVAVDAHYAMDPAALDAAVENDHSNGYTPCAVTATTGTTTCTALDPIAAVAGIAKRRGLWLHIDGAMAGSAMILPECRWMWSGVEGADSIVVNAHKWLGAAFDCSLYYVRDSDHLVRVMSTNPSYLRSALDGRVKNLRDWGIPLGRRFRALKLWCLLRAEGAEALRVRLRRDLANAAWLAQRIAAEPQWRVLAPVPLQTLCVRREPPGLAGDALDRYTNAWAEALNRSGDAYVTPATLDGRWMVRVSIGAIPTEREHAAQLWDAMRREADRALPRG